MNPTDPVSENNIRLCGRVVSEPCFSHENHGRRFYRFFVECPRLSEASDTLPILAAEELLPRMPQADDWLTVVGQVRSWSNHTPTGRHLLLSVFAEQLQFDTAEPCNELSVCGTICKPPIIRRTPLGREICDAMLAAARSYGRTDYLPCIFWGATARMVAARSVGDTVRFTGRMQSRPYRKVLPDGTAEWRTALELSALTVQ